MSMIFLVDTSQARRGAKWEQYTRPVTICKGKGDLAVPGCGAAHARRSGKRFQLLFDMVLAQV
jgi:hypothetical protein